jgi:hypothetical protein
MRALVYLPILSVSLLVACAEISDNPAGGATDPSTDPVGRIGANRIGANRIGANRIGANRIGANRLSANRLSDNRLGNGRMHTNMDGASMLLATPEGREVFSVLVECALDPNTTLVATVNGAQFEFTGEMDLASQWLFAPLDSVGQRWVSACVFSKVNAHDVSVTLSFRGPRFGLRTTANERNEFPVEEGAFFGDLFVPLDQPIQWFACRGEGQASGEFGGLVDRDCTEPDPAHPGLTQCGFFFAGDCGDFARNHACDAFVEHPGFYLGCHTAPIQRQPRRNDQVFCEVVTTFVTP